MKKIKFGVSNFFKNNTPKPAQIIGDVALTLAAVASLPAVLASASIAVPAAIVAVGAKAASALVIVKFVSKFLGVKVDDENVN